MTDFSKILDKAKELEAKMKESQEKIKNIKVEGVSGSNSVKVTLDGEGEMQTEDREEITIGEEYDRVYKGVNDPVLKDSGIGKTVSMILYTILSAIVVQLTHIISSPSSL